MKNAIFYQNVCSLTHKIVVLALLVKTARSVPFTGIEAVFLAILYFYLNPIFFIENALILCYATVRALLTFKC
jgi:hypothetical protein